MLTRLLIAIIPLVASLLAPNHAARPLRAAADGDTVSQAAMRLGHGSRASVLSWLRSRPAVARVAIGADGETVDITFKDGQQGAILPSGMQAVPIDTGHASPHSGAHTGPVVGRAAVLEPFATELSLGPHAGDPETAALRSAGFTVDDLYDGAVTVDTMLHVSRYQVVYMLTHSGVNAQGEGVIATGEPANGDPAVQPYLDDHTVMIVGIVNDPGKYYGFLSGFVRQHIGQFPTNALIMVNGCSILRAKLVWQAFQTKGVDSFVSWDNEAMSNDDTMAARIFFDSMAHGGSVVAAVRDVYNAGYGRSTVDSTTAQLGFLGDPDLTLDHILVPPPTPTPSATPTATETPTSTPLPTATPAPTPMVTPDLTHRHPWPMPITLRTAVSARPG